MELIKQYEWLFYGILTVLALLMVLCLTRAVIGPRIADRLVAVNMMGTLVMVSIALLMGMVIVLQFVGSSIPPIGGLVSISLVLIPIVLGAAAFAVPERDHGWSVRFRELLGH